MEQSNKSIAITLKSHLTPSFHIEEFRLGKEFQVSVTAGITLNDFIEKMFFGNKEQIGFKIVNGQIRFKDVVLAEGDTVEVNTLISGG